MFILRILQVYAARCVLVHHWLPCLVINGEPQFVRGIYFSAVFACRIGCGSEVAKKGSVPTGSNMCYDACEQYEQ
jgi:hypothetical protein